ncbi:MAG: DUF3551 domain-containing protein [Xanthobacteraceae bacterium]|nr:DUF3551 domain-containing protein [Xanthobacteraceae bacterium]
MRFLSLLAAAMLVPAGPLAAQSLYRLLPHERYCMDAEFQGASTGVLCRFTTIDQCLASRRSREEKCFLNPILAFEQQQKKK